MDLAGTVINALVVAAVGAVLAWLGKGRFEAQERRIDRLEERLERRADALQASIEAMRSDLTQVALAVGVRPRAENA
ncbi:MAG TPA: hypothetical protein VFZ75_10600 [Actinomycetota bacterium]|nr:hypothetical protein [Actinomycetota bacterium]